MTTQTSYFVGSDDIIRTVVFDIDTGAFDCSQCAETAAAHPGYSLWNSSGAARAGMASYRFGLEAAGQPVERRPGNDGFICYGGQRAFAWNPETGESIEPAETTTMDAAAAVADAIADQERGHYVLPRTAADAVALAQQLQGFARWLPGGELEGIGHEHAATANLCGEYERIVCPTFGWTPRRGEGNSMQRYTTQFFADMDAFERDNAQLPPLARLTKWMERYQAGGFANRAVIDHAEAHLESYKRESVAELLTDTLGWEAGNLAGPTEYEVTVRVERTRTITEHAYVTVTVEADDEDTAADMAIDIADPDDGYTDWSWDDEDITEDDRTVYEMTPA